ncbi:ATP-grasp domain-containing protein [Bartonella taylorii]|uniref:ATP-grasp domain-containing protein n=1 Tax=Bartonella taylorii TaxID=33046 RepID=UPI001ABAE2D1|nr:ATP-grasp domain-containing protein [Bartonella taylorii]
MAKTKGLIFPVILVTSERMKAEVEDIVKRYTHLIGEYIIIQERYNQTSSTPQKNCIQISDMENIEILKSLAVKITDSFKPTHIVAMEEFAVSSAYYLEKFFKLEPKLSLERMLRFRNKAMMAEKISKTGKLVQPVQYTKEDVFNNRTTYPIVIKPIDQAASIGVMLCKNQNEALNALKKISDPIIQEYISDNLYHIDVLVENTKCIFYSVGCYQENAGYGAINGAPLVSIIETDRQKLLRWNEFITEAIETFNPPNGALHIEAFYRDSSPHLFLEIGLRPAGGLIPMMIKASSDIDIIEGHFLLSIGVSVEEKYAKPRLKAASLIHFPKLPNNISQINVENIFLPETGYKSEVYYMKTASVGESATAEMSYSNTLADIIFTSTNPQSVVADTQHALCKFSVNTIHKDFNFNVMVKAGIETSDVLFQMQKAALEDGFILPGWKLLVSSFIFEKHQTQALARDFYCLYKMIFSLKDKLFSGSQKQWFKNLGLSDQLISVLQRFKIQGDCIPYRWDFFISGNQIKVIELNTGLALGGHMPKEASRAEKYSRLQR